jgi:hypothetical protein
MYGFWGLGGIVSSGVGEKGRGSGPLGGNSAPESLRHGVSLSSTADKTAAVAESVLNPPGSTGPNLSGRVTTSQDSRSDIVLAARQSDLPLFQSILNGEPKISAEDLGIKLYQEAIKGNLADIDAILSSGLSYDKSYLEMAISAAVDTKNEEVLVRFAQISTEALSAVLIRAQNMQNFDKFLDKVWNGIRPLVKELDVEKMMFHALDSTGDTFNPDLILILSKFSQEALEYALIVTVDVGRFDLFEKLVDGRSFHDIFLTSDQREIYNFKANTQLERRRLVFEGAVKKSDLKTINKFIDEAGPQVKKKMKCWAILLGVQFGQRDLINTLLPKIPQVLSEINGLGDMKNALQSNRNDPEIIHFLELLENLGPDFFGKIFDEAAKTGDLEIAQDLGRFMNILFCTKEPFHVMGFFETALNSATENGHAHVVELLLSSNYEWTNKPIHTGKALKIAAQHGKLEVVDLLLKKLQEILPEGVLAYRYESMHEAARSKNFEILGHLMRDDQGFILPLDQSELEMIYIFAQDFDYPHADLIETFFQNVLSLTPTFKSFLLDQITSNFSNIGPQQREVLLGMCNSIPCRGEIVTDVQSYRETDGTLIVPNWEDLAQYPLEYLSSAVQIRFCRISFGQGKVLDFGGVTKEFVTRLVQSLKEKNYIQVQEDFWALLPVAENEDQERALVLFGSLLALLKKSNVNRSDKIMIPRILDPNVFDSIGKEEGEKLTNIECPDELKEVWKNPENPNTDTLEKIKQAMVFEGTDEELKTKIQQWKGSVIRALGHINAGLDQELQQAIKDEGFCLNLGVEFFGKEITADALLQKLNVLMPNSYENSFKKMVSWVREWIREASQEELEKFVICITGNRSLGSLPINISQNEQEGHRGESVEVHSCFNSLWLPRLEQIAKEDFLRAFAIALDSKDPSSYTVA